MKKQLLSIIAVALFIGGFQQVKAQTGAALNFAGSQYVNVPDNANLDFGTADFTIEADFQSSISQPNYAGIVAKDVNGGSNGGWQLVIVNNNIAAEFTDGTNFFGTGSGLQGSITLTDGNWHHLAMVVSRSTGSITLYVDGVVDGSATNPTISTMNITNTSVPMLIGVERTISAFANGNIDEVKIWNIARTQAAIQNNMNCAIASNATGLVAYYNFDNGIPNGNNTSITTVPDLTTNANTGTLTNFALTGTTSNFVGNTTFSVQVTTTITATSNTVCAGTPVTLTATTTTGGTSPYMYTWHPGGTAGSSATLTNTTTITPSATSTVTAVKKWWALVTDANGCAFTNDTVAVQVNSLPQVGTLASTTITCAGSPVTLTAVPVGGGLAPLSYTWHPGGTAPSATVTTITPSATTTTSVKKWFMTVQDANGCVFTNDTVAVQVNALPNVTINGASSSTIIPCPNVTGTLTAAGANTYTWTPGNLHTTTITGAPTSPVTFTLTGIDVNGCNNTATEFVNVLPKPTLTVTPLVSNICVGTTATITVSGASTYTWNTGIVGTTITPSPTVTTNYTVTGTGANSCTSAAVALINVDNAVITVNSASICIGNMATLTANGANSYTWSTTETTTSITPSPTVTTDYTVSGTDLNNCVSTTTSTVTVNILPSVTIHASSFTLCAGTPDTLRATVTGGLAPMSYTWHPGGTAVNHDTTIITPSATSTVTSVKKWFVVVTDANGCTTSNDTVAVQVNSLPQMTTHASALTICAGTPDTLRGISIGGGLAPMTYTWHPGGTNANKDTTIITPSATSTVTAVKKWFMTVKDANGCVFTNDTVSVLVNSLPQMTTNASALTICAGTPDTLRGISIGGGLAPLTYTWHPSGTTANKDTTIITPSFTATTSVKKWFMTVKDANGCVFTNDTVAVQINALPTITITPSTNTVCVGSTITLTASGAGSGTYTWTNTGATGVSITPSPTVTTQYTVTGTDGNNCMNTDTLTIMVNNCTTGIEGNSVVSNISLYPNPNNGSFTIRGTCELNDIHIINELGQVIQSISLKQTNNYEVTLSGLDKGVYYLIGGGSNSGQAKQRFIVIN
jgi:concanavalin A-like lectin/glucanase superfamily protein/type IX secretion system substrate protein